MAIFGVKPSDQQSSVEDSPVSSEPVATDADADADADAGVKQVEFKQIECYSCKVISDGLCFILPGYLLYHTYKNRPLLSRRQRFRLYMANGSLAAVLLLTGVCSVMKIGIFDPKNKNKDAFDVAMDELQYLADKLGISQEEPPSD